MCCMTVTDAKTDLRKYLQDAREALLWKLDGLSEYDIRRPLVATGTNLLGLVQHLIAASSSGTSATPSAGPRRPPAWDEADPDSELFAEPDESRDFITGRYRRAWAHADITISELPLDAIGHVPWWPPTPTR